MTPEEHGAILREILAELRTMNARLAQDDPKKPTKTRGKAKPPASPGRRDGAPVSYQPSDIDKAKAKRLIKELRLGKVE